VGCSEGAYIGWLLANTNCYAAAWQADSRGGLARPEAVHPDFDNEGLRIPVRAILYWQKFAFDSVTVERNISDLLQSWPLLLTQEIALQF
jgi:hypothetical protein